MNALIVMLYNQPMRARLFSGVFFLGFLMAAGLTGALTRTPTADAPIIRGDAARRIERDFTAALPLYDPARAAWGAAEYALFRQGRPGVVVGEDGWLFTAEEFFCGSNVAQDIERIRKIETAIKTRGARLVIALIPAKARLAQILPACRAPVYEQVLTALADREIAAPPLRSILTLNSYLRADTHWRPKGAQDAAHAVAAILPHGRKAYDMMQTSRNHQGDLTRYLPGVIIAPETVITPLAVDKEAHAADLFGDAAPAIALVGTSYSADTTWGFDAFLKKALQTDILNVADPGLDPFAAMDRYLASAAWRDHRPEIVIWEIPERYLGAAQQFDFQP